MITYLCDHGRIWGTIFWVEIELNRGGRGGLKVLMEQVQSLLDTSISLPPPHTCTSLKFPPAYIAESPPLGSPLKSLVGYCGEVLIFIMNAMFCILVVVV